ncbi:MAG: endonuclease/exonuclease/phosphatase family protein [Planctomycetota bacterium]|jgi:endonuclease/exonuclease/phosphatase family metal-dependent hydrolase
MNTSSRVLFAIGLLLAAAVAGAAPAQSGDRSAVNRYGRSTPLPRRPGTVRLATYNMLNLFDHVDDPTLSGDIDDMSLAAAPERCRKLAEAIRTIDADIVALQEIESLEALRWFRDTYLPDAGYGHVASLEAGYYRGVENSVLSRFPIVDARVWPGLPLDDVRREGPGWSELPADAREGLAFRRSPLMVDIQVSDDYRLTLFVVHHKSGRDYRYYREAEALKVLELIERATGDDPGRNVVVLGDFNAAPWDKSLRVYLEHGFADPLAHRIIPRWRNAEQDEARLFKTHESDRVIDYILLNPAAYRDLVIGSAHVYGTLTPPDSYDWRTDPHPPGYASDHYPVVIDLVPADRP